MPITPTPHRIATDAWGAWDRFLTGHPDAGFHQSSWWAVVHRRNGEGAFGVMIRRNGIVHGGATVVRIPWDAGHAWYHIVDGPLLPPDPALAEEVLWTILSTIQRRRAREPVVITHLRVEPRWPELPPFVHALGPLVVGPAHRVTTIDLGASETSILAQMSRTARASVALARQLGLRITEDGGPRGVNDLRRLVERTVVTETGAETPDAERLLPLLQDTRHGGIFFAEDGEERLAGAAILQFGARATLLVAAADSLVADAPAPALLQFEVMRRAKAHHCQEYDLGRLSTQFGTFGGASRTQVGPIDIVFSPTPYERFSRAGPEGSGLVE